MHETMTRDGDGPRRRRMIRGTIVRIGELTMRYGQPSQLATLDCTSSRRSTVMCALPRAIAVTTVYERDSSSKRPRSSVVFADRVLTRAGSTTWRTWRPGLRTPRGAPAAPLDTTPATWSEAVRPASGRLPASVRPPPLTRCGNGGLDKGHSI